MELKLIAITAASFAAVVAGGVLFMPGTGLGDDGSSDDSSTVLLDATSSLMDPGIAGSNVQAGYDDGEHEYDDDDEYEDHDDEYEDDHDDDDHDEHDEDHEEEDDD